MSGGTFSTQPRYRSLELSEKAKFLGFLSILLVLAVNWIIFIGPYRFIQVMCPVSFIYCEAHPKVGSAVFCSILFMYSYMRVVNRLGRIMPVHSTPFYVSAPRKFNNTLFYLCIFSVIPVVAVVFYDNTERYTQITTGQITVRSGLLSPIHHLEWQDVQRVHAECGVVRKDGFR